MVRHWLIYYNSSSSQSSVLTHCYVVLQQHKSFIPGQTTKGQSDWGKGNSRPTLDERHWCVICTTPWKFQLYILMHYSVDANNHSSGILLWRDEHILHRWSHNQLPQELFYEGDGFLMRPVMYVTHSTDCIRAILHPGAIIHWNRIRNWLQIHERDSSNRKNPTLISTWMREV